MNFLHAFYCNSYQKHKNQLENRKLVVWLKKIQNCKSNMAANKQALLCNYVSPYCITISSKENLNWKYFITELLLIFSDIKKSWNIPMQMNQFWITKKQWVILFVIDQKGFIGIVYTVKTRLSNSIVLRKDLIHNRLTIHLWFIMAIDHKLLIEMTKGLLLPIYKQ